MTPVEKLSRMARSWGGAILRVDEETFNTRYARAEVSTHDGEAWITQLNPVKGFYPAPFSTKNLGVFWSRKQIIYTGENMPWPDIVHEAAHVFACKVNPNRCDEWPFLGWEYAMAKYLGGPMTDWFKYMRDYVVDGRRGDTFGDFSPSRRQLVLQERLRAARSLKLVVGDVPQSIRRPK